MRWFRINKSFYASGTMGTFEAYNVVTIPVLYLDAIYGTESNPMYKIYVKNNVVSRTSKVYMTSTANRDTEWYRIAGSATDETLDWGEELENATISGRYRFGTYLEGNLYGGWGIPLNYTIIKNDKSTQEYDYIRAINGDNRFVNRLYCGMYFGSVETNTGFSIGTTSSDAEAGDIPIEYHNCVIDFGTVPQNIPKFIKDWIELNTEIDYGSNDYYVRSQNGSLTYATIEDAPNIVSAELSVVDNMKTLTLTGADGNEYVMEWVSDNPPGKKFNGLALQSFRKQPKIPVGYKTSLYLDDNTVLYETYLPYNELSSTFAINLYNNIAEQNRVDKTNYIQSVGTINGVLRDSTSITTLNISFETGNVPTFNYVYIPAFNRYYFVNDITAIRSNLWEMSLSVDVLMTYKDAILNCTAFVDRNEFSNRPYVIDNKRVILEGKDVEYEAVTNELFTSTLGWWVLTGFQVNVVRDN